MEVSGCLHFLLFYLGIRWMRAWVDFPAPVCGEEKSLAPKGTRIPIPRPFNPQPVNN
jgi:hypothetical protein